MMLNEDFTWLCFYRAKAVIIIYYSDKQTKSSCWQELTSCDPHFTLRTVWHIPGFLYCIISEHCCCWFSELGVIRSDSVACVLFLCVLISEIHGGGAAQIKTIKVIILPLKGTAAILIYALKWFPITSTLSAWKCHPQLPIESFSEIQ